MASVGIDEGAVVVSSVVAGGTGGTVASWVPETATRACPLGKAWSEIPQLPQKV